MASPSPVPLIFPPGLQRDGTQLDSDRSVDALWTRWRLGRPRKIGGFTQATAMLPGIARKLSFYYSNADIIIHAGTNAGIHQVVVDQFGNFVSYADRTPATFEGGINVGWTIDALFNAGATNSSIIAHAAPDLATTASIIKTTPFIGQIDATTPLTALSNPAPNDGVYATPELAGGILCTPPYLWGFDANGFVQWCAPNLPEYLGVSLGTSGAGNARISANKIVAGASGPISPSAFFWSLNEVFSATFVGAPAIWDFVRLTRSSSILSTDVVVEYDNLFFWAGLDRFYMYNGIVLELPNNQNQDYFFNNMNWAFASKAYGFKIPRYGEIWFCAPLFNNTECSHAIIYNIRDNTWYDTELPNGGRGTGKFDGGFRYPVMGGVVATPTGYPLWIHENGVDQIVNGLPTAIRAYFETPIFGGGKNSQPTNDGLTVEQFELDAIQSGDLTVSVIGSANQRAPVQTGQPALIREVPQVSQDQIPGLRDERRQLRFHVESNTLGGSYIIGRTFAHMASTRDARVLG